MKTKDLIILTFPGDVSEKDEVRLCGLHLFTKHVRKHMLKKDLPNKEILEMAQKPIDTDTAQRAWLIEITNSRETEETDALVEGKHYKILQATSPFKPGTFDRDTGVYIVCHNQSDVTQVFDYYPLTLDKRITDEVPLLRKYELAASRGAAGVARIFKGLGINSVRKLCMAACTMATQVYQKGFLMHLVSELAVIGLRPMVAGWDIPITVAETGSKLATGVRTGPLNKEHKHKFIYLFKSADISSATSDPGKVSEALQMFAKKQMGLKDVEHRKKFEDLVLSKKVTTDDSGKGKPKVTLSIDFVDRIKYCDSGWSSSKF